MEPLSNLC